MKKWLFIATYSMLAFLKPALCATSLKDLQRAQTSHTKTQLVEMMEASKQANLQTVAKGRHVLSNLKDAMIRTMHRAYIATLDKALEAKKEQIRRYETRTTALEKQAASLEEERKNAVHRKEQFEQTTLKSISATARALQEASYDLTQHLKQKYEAKDMDTKRSKLELREQYTAEIALMNREIRDAESLYKKATTYLEQTGNIMKETVAAAAIEEVLAKEQGIPPEKVRVS